MKRSSLKQSNIQDQNRQRGYCRKSFLETPYDSITAKGTCRRSGLKQQTTSSAPPAEPVIGKNRALLTLDIHMLKEQAARLNSALQEIEAQIKAFEPRQIK